MKLCPLLVVMAVAFHGIDAFAAEEATADADQLQGAWVEIAAEVAGRRFTSEELRRTQRKIIFRGDKVLLKGGAFEDPLPVGGGYGHYVVGGANPGTLDIRYGGEGNDLRDRFPEDYKGYLGPRPKPGGLPAGTLPCIYDLEGDVLQIRFGAFNAAHPRSFGTRASGKPDEILVIFRRYEQIIKEEGGQYWVDPTDPSKPVVAIASSQPLDVQALAGYPRLRQLCLAKGRLSQVRYLRGLPRLEVLHLDEMLGDDKQFEQFEGLVQLQILGLSGTHISTVDGTPTIDLRLKHLQTLTKLKYLDLSNTDVSDGGLEHLKALTGLRLLNLIGTRVTEEGVKGLRRTLPDCEIIY
jgi:hypothetical protein